MKRGASASVLVQSSTPMLMTLRSWEGAGEPPPEGFLPLPELHIPEGSREFPSSDFPTHRVWMTLSVTSFLLHSLPIS